MTGRTITTVNPATGQPLATYAAFDEGRVESVLVAAAAAHQVWAQRPLSERTELLRAVGGLLSERRHDYAALITGEMGKPLSEALAELDKCAWNCEVVADSAEAWLADHEVASAAERSWISYQPLGVVFAVMPWNYPFWQVLRFACAALVSGNAGVLKHSPNVTGCALAIHQLFTDAGAPDGLFAALVLHDEDLPSMTPRIIGDARVAAVTLTGSERAGETIGSLAGRHLKKSVLELGGSDPFVVLADADLDAAAAAAAKSRFGNGGQSCISAKRFVVVEDVADAFVQLLVEQVALLEVGDPVTPGTTVGPLARPDLREAVHRQVVTSVGQGATLVCGGEVIDGAGYYYAPTVLDHIEPRMTAFDEETFGPVAALVRARDDNHAVELANDTEYGLGASVWGSTQHALAVGRRIRSGALFINAMVASDPRLPFGGIGRSGYGRELSAEGTREFTNVRTVFVGAS